MKTLKGIFIFLGIFLIYHLIGCSIYPTDENNYLQAPTWYPVVGILVSSIITYLYLKKSGKRKHRENIISNIKRKKEYENLSEVEKWKLEKNPQEVVQKPAMEKKSFCADSDSFYQYGGTEAELLTIDLMEGHQFENWCADLLKKNKFLEVVVTPGSGDQGVDITAIKDGIRYAIQCKCYSSPLGNKPVQEVNTGKIIYHCQIGVVMTNSFFTQGAKDAASATGVLLWDRDKLKEMIERRGIYEQENS